MKTLAFLLAFAAVAPSPACAAARVGLEAPTFAAVDTKKEVVSLYEFRGKTVVLEWLSKDCPAVKKHYASGNMQRLQKNLKQRGGVWLSVLAPTGARGAVSAAQADADTKAQGAEPTAVLPDRNGELARLYGARATPQVFVIDKEGVLRYAGAVDSNASLDPETIQSSENFVLSALDALGAGKPVKTPTTKPYGCPVKR